MVDSKKEEQLNIYYTNISAVQLVLLFMKNYQKSGWKTVMKPRLTLQDLHDA